MRCSDYGHDVGGWDWVWMIAMMGFAVVLLVALVWATVALVRREHPTGPSEPTAIEELDRRLARGEIDTDEYKRRRDAMRPVAR